MKAITLYAPLAGCMALGYKTIETRAQNTLHRGDVLIHSSANTPLTMRKLYTDRLSGHRGIHVAHAVNSLLDGYIIGKCCIDDTMRTEDALSYLDGCVKAAVLSDYRRSEIIAYGDFAPGRWAYLLSKPVLFSRPVANKGSLGVWETMNKRNLEVARLAPRGIPFGAPEGHAWGLYYFGKLISHHKSEEEGNEYMKTVIESGKGLCLTPRLSEIQKIEQDLFYNNTTHSNGI